MSLIVLKFGGTSVGSIKKINYVAKIIKKHHHKKNKLIVVSSAMSGVTNDLIKKSKQISKNFDKFEYDVLLSSGEQIACALLSGALLKIGLKSRSWLSWQIPIITKGDHKSSRIISINKKEILKYVNSGGIPIITGFQGISNNRRITTLGRGGSDATAISIAKFFSADDCFIYTDVSGVYTTDPKLNSKAKKIKKISYEEMLEMASLGAKIMQPISLQDAMINDIDINVRSTFINSNGTKISNNQQLFNKNPITGIAFTKNEAKITLIGVMDRPGTAASIFKPLADNQINVDMVVQTSSPDGGQTDITFTIIKDDIKNCIKILKENKKISYKKIIHDDKVSKVSIVGAGMIATPGVTYRMFQALAKKKINIMVISTSEIKISVLINQKNIKKAIRVLHKEFDLD
jgi:aspartate kinase|tara:strand:+ start:1010 stop:2221 length:1212 start_codon:yes stop_codon:yes gene_type:complete